MRTPIKATARVPINRPDTYQRLPTALPHLRRAAGPYIWGKTGSLLTTPRTTAFGCFLVIRAYPARLRGLFDKLGRNRVGAVSFGRNERIDTGRARRGDRAVAGGDRSRPLPAIRRVKTWKSALGEVRPRIVPMAPPTPRPPLPEAPMRSRGGKRVRR